jgi:hypothetical protein
MDGRVPTSISTADSQVFPGNDSPGSFSPASHDPPDCRNPRAVLLSSVNSRAASASLLSGRDDVSDVRRETDARTEGGEALPVAAESTAKGLLVLTVDLVRQSVAVIVDGTDVVPA